MTLFLTGFYFGGVLSTFLALISGALLNSTARDNMLVNPLGIIFIILFWPYSLLKSIYTLMH